MSKPDDIPQDVRSLAWEVYFERCNTVDRLAPEFEEEEVVDLVARAILAERERCAQVCDAFIQAYDEEIASLGLEQARRGSPAKYAVKCIAADIRGGKHV